MCWGCDSVPLEFEWHHSHLVRQSEGSAVQINHSRQARLQPEGNFSESLNANILHYSWGRSALVPKQTEALTDKSNVEVYILPWQKVMGFICDNTHSKPRCWTGWTSGVCVRMDYNFSWHWFDILSAFMQHHIYDNEVLHTNQSCLVAISKGIEE